MQTQRENSLLQWGRIETRPRGLRRGPRQPSPEREDLTSRGVPRSQLQPQAWPVGRRPKPQRARGRRSPARGAGRLPGRVPAGQAPGSRAETPLCGLRGAGGVGGGGAELAGQRVGGAWPPLRPPARSAARGQRPGTVGAAGAKLSLILGKTSAGKVGVERGGERRGRSIGARSSAPHLPRRLLASQQMAGAGDAGTAGGSHALPRP